MSNSPENGFQIPFPDKSSEPDELVGLSQLAFDGGMPSYCNNGMCLDM